MCDLFIPCVSANRRRNLKQALKTQEKKKKKKSIQKGCGDRHSFVYYEILYNNKGKGQTGH